MSVEEQIETLRAICLRQDAEIASLRREVIELRREADARREAAPEPTTRSAMGLRYR